MNKRILIVDDEESIRDTFASFLAGKGYDPVTAGTYDEALSLLSKNDFDLVFADILLGGRTGIDLLRKIKKSESRCPVVMITGAPDVGTASEAVRLGAFDYIPKPVKKDAILHVAGMALQYKEMADESEKYRSNLEAIFRSVKDAIITVDMDMNVVETNESAENICGFSRGTIGKSFAAISHGCSGKCLELLKKSMDSKKHVELHRAGCNRPNHNEQIVTMSAAPLFDSRGIFSGAVLVVRDETRLYTLERDLGERRDFHNIIGKSEHMQKIYRLIESLADVDTTVLITGESGTGKELIAEAIHYTGARSKMPLVKVNCSALSENLLESELFGHVKGAFTGAIRDKIGRFQKADGGTIFLDEVGDMSPAMQLRLLRVLQEKEFERVGGLTPVKVDVRVIAATNKALSDMLSAGTFREDLYYRLKVMELNVPPLRERREDIPLLIDHFLGKFNVKLNREINAVSEDVRRIFMEYPWPGNIRELEHSLEHAFILCSNNSVITTEHLPDDLKNFSEHKTSFSSGSGDDEIEKILGALEKTGWNKAGAARLLGMSRRTLYRKMEEHNITKEK